MKEVQWGDRRPRLSVVLSVDDVHPAPVAESALAHLRWLQERHPQLKATLFTTPDWRSSGPYTAEMLPEGTYRLDRHPSFCDLLRTWPGIELALHGLHHVGPPSAPIAEFAGATREQCRSILQRAMSIFDDAGLPFVRGLCPPAWHATEELVDAMGDLEMRFIASARDLTTPVSRDAKTNGSGMHGVSLIEPQRVGALLHFTTNFQATSTIERACAILDAGGVLAIKAHLLSESGTYKALDGLSGPYRDELDRLFSTLEDSYGDAIVWTSMGALAA